MKIKRIMSLILAIGVAANLLAGCNQSGNSASSGKKETNETASPSPAVLGEQFSGYPMNELDKTLSIWAGVWDSNIVSTWKEHPWLSGLAEQVGVTVDWQYGAAGTDVNQAFNQLLAGKDLPDILWHNDIMPQAGQLLADGVIRDIPEDMLEKYAPNFYKYVKEDEYRDKSMKTDEGQYYGFGFFRESPWQSSYMGPMVRKDWLDEQNLAIPETIAEFENVIRVFKEKYNAKFAFAPNWRITPGPAGAFGAYGSFETVQYIDKNDKVQITQTQPEFKEYMTWMNKLNKENLIDPDVVTLDDQGLRTKVANNQVGITFTSLGNMNGYIGDAAQAGSPAKWIGIPYPVMNKGDKVTAIFAEDITVPRVAAITANCPDDKVPLALRFLDYAFSEPGYYYWNFGKEGESWTMVNQVPTFTELVTKHELGLNDASGLYSGNTGWGLGVQSLALVQQRLAPEAKEAGDAWFNGNEEATKYIYPTGVTMKASEQSEYSMLRTTIDAYIKETTLKFLTGEEPLDNFDKFVDDLKGMGLDRMLELRQAAYDRFLAR